jgi:hypothetical protein
MLLNLSHAIKRPHSPLRVLSQQLLHQRPSRFTYKTRYLNLIPQNHPIHLFPVRVVEWRDSSQHFVEQGTEAVEIHAAAMARFFQHFRAHVLGRSSKAVRQVVWSHPLLA